MKKLFILITLTILAAGTLLFTQSAPIGEQARLLLILPVHNLSKKSDTEKTEKYTVLLWRSLYNFTLHIPSMEVPPRDEIDILSARYGIKKLRAEPLIARDLGDRFFLCFFEKPFPQRGEIDFYLSHIFPPAFRQYYTPELFF